MKMLHELTVDQVRVGGWVRERGNLMWHQVTKVLDLGSYFNVTYARARNNRRGAPLMLTDNASTFGGESRYEYRDEIDLNEVGIWYETETEVTYWGRKIKMDVYRSVIQWYGFFKPRFATILGHTDIYA